MSRVWNANRRLAPPGMRSQARKMSHGGLANSRAGTSFTELAPVKLMMRQESPTATRRVIVTKAGPSAIGATQCFPRRALATAPSPSQDCCRFSRRRQVLESLTAPRSPNYRQRLLVGQSHELGFLSPAGRSNHAALRRCLWRTEIYLWSTASGVRPPVDETGDGGSEPIPRLSGVRLAEEAAAETADRSGDS